MKRIPLYIVTFLLLSGGISAVVRSGQTDHDEAKQREYDRAYDVLFPVAAKGLTLRERVDRELRKGVPPAGSEFKIFKAGMAFSSENPEDAGLTREARAQRLLAKELRDADLVFRGRLQSSESKITPDERWVFTINRIEVTEVIAQRTDTVIGDTLIVIRSGGVVEIDGYPVRAIDEDYPPLSADDGEIVLFLNAVPNSNAYYTLSTDGSFAVGAGTIRQLTRHPRDEFSILTADAFRKALETEIQTTREDN